MRNLLSFTFFLSFYLQKLVVGNIETFGKRVGHNVLEIVHRSLFQEIDFCKKHWNSLVRGLLKSI